MPIFIKLTIFLQSFLFFAIQPAVAKLLLPKIGGSSQAWIVTLLFFQCFLLFGYSLNLIIDKKNKVISLIILGCVGFYLNHIFIDFKIESNFDLLKFLILNYGAFSILLAFSNPFLQKIASSYSLYSVSNTGSLLALLCYPFVIEKYLNLSTQFLIFKVVFLVFIAMLLVSVLKTRPTLNKTNIKFNYISKNFFYVFLYSLSLNALLIIVTNNLCLHFAEAPFLWILPLVVFLIAFIFGFLEKEIIANNILNRLTNYSFIILPAFLVFTIKINLISYLSITLISFLLICYKIVREIFNLKPEISKLVPFYIYLSAGGVLGTILVGIISPILFVHFYEIVFAFCLVFLLLNKRVSKTYALLIILIALLSFFNFSILNKSIVLSLYLLSVFLVIFLLKKENYKFILFTLLVSISFALNKSSSSKKLLAAKRNYYGVKEVKSIDNVNHFFHSNVVHGIQDLKNPKKVYAYAGKNSVVYDVISKLNQKKERKDVLIIGLGIGNIAAYSQDDNYTFIEIDPQVVQIAKNEKYFTYLKNCKTCNVIVGDGRIETEKLNKKFDLIVLDAFTSGAVPLHLITKEALLLYKSKLKENGLIVFNISHSYFNILKALSTNTSELGLNLIYKESKSYSKLEYPNKYAVLANPKNLILTLLKEKNYKSYNTKNEISDWTDEKSSLIEILY